MQTEPDSIPEPSVLLVHEAFVVACALGAVASIPFSPSQKALVSVMSFMTIAFLHCVVFGGPAYWLLRWKSMDSPFACAVAGALIGLVSYGAWLGPGLGGPGVSYGYNLLAFGVSGAAIGFVFRRYLRMRTGEAAAAPAMGKPAFVPRPPQVAAENFLTGSTSGELFNLFKRGHAGHPYMREVIELAQPRFEARKVAELAVRIAPDASGPNRYAITVTNRGARAFEALRVHYEALLLFAEHFGLDTTHMPDDMARIAGEPLLIDSLPAGQSVTLVRPGYATRDRYDGPREAALDVEFNGAGLRGTAADRRWCLAEVAV